MNKGRCNKNVNKNYKVLFMITTRIKIFKGASTNLHISIGFCLLFCNSAFYILGWPGIHYVDKNDLELMNPPLPPCMVSLVLGIKPMAFCMLGNHSSNSATSEASGGS